MREANIPAERIVIVGQSLGTAVASAVGLHFANSASELLPSLPGSLTQSSEVERKPTVFAGIILVAPFSSLPSLLLSYRIGGILPVLAPLRPYPYLQKLIGEYILDKWPSAERLAAYYHALANSPAILNAEKEKRDVGGLQILHAVNDADISYHQTQIIWATIRNEMLPSWARSSTVKIAGYPKIKMDIVEHGGGWHRESRFRVVADGHVQVITELSRTLRLRLL